MGVSVGAIVEVDLIVIVGKAVIIRANVGKYSAVLLDWVQAESKTTITESMKKRCIFWVSLLEARGLTEWLSGGGGTGETRLNDCAFAGKPRPTKKRPSRCPLQPVLGRLCKTVLNLMLR